MTPGNALTVHVGFNRALLRRCLAWMHATAPSDFVANSGVLTFSPGQTHGSVTVQIKGDRVKEPNEVFYVLLTNAHNATIGTPNAVGGILSDD